MKLWVTATTGLIDTHGHYAATGVDEHIHRRSYRCVATPPGPRINRFSKTRSEPIELGKEAEIAVWDHDLYTVPAADIKNLKCELTLFACRVVYQDIAARIVIRK